MVRTGDEKDKAPHAGETLIVGVEPMKQSFESNSPEMEKL
jgi:hypothetical protein